MNDFGPDLKPIDAYFAQGLRGDSRWFTWLIGAWLAIFIWVLGQTVLGIPMFGAMLIADPDLFQQLLSGMQQDATTPKPAWASALSSLIILGPLIAIPIYLLLGKARSGSALRQALVIIASAAAIGSAIALFYSLKTQPAGANDIISAFIPKSAAVYASLLITFPPLIGGLWLAVRVIHKRTFKSLMTAAKRFRWKRVFFSMAVFWAIAGAITLFSHVTGINTVSFVFDGGRFWTYAIISLLFIPLQSATEEIMLRGYMNQGLGKYIKNPWIVFVITSGLFAALHLGNPEAAEGAANGRVQHLMTMSSYFFFGFFACVLTYIDGGLESAIGVHAANNLYASILLGYDNSALPTPTVMNTTLNPQYDTIITILALALVCTVMWKFRTPLDADMPKGARQDDSKFIG